MANLTKSDLGKRGNEEIFLKKFFEMDHRMNLFNVKRKSKWQQNIIMVI